MTHHHNCPLDFWQGIGCVLGGAAGIATAFSAPIGEVPTGFLPAE